MSGMVGSVQEYLELCEVVVRIQRIVQFLAS